MIALDWIKIGDDFFIKIDELGRKICEIKKEQVMVINNNPGSLKFRNHKWISEFATNIFNPIDGKIESCLRFHIDKLDDAKCWADLFLKQKGYRILNMSYEDFDKKYGAMK